MLFRIVIVLSLSFAALIASSQNYTLVWEDNFDGNALNTNNWNYEVGGHGWGNNELQYYTSGTNNATVSNGKLIIEAKQESFGGRNYTSARLSSQNKGDWKFGRIEASIKVPETQGMWPAFWMSPTRAVYGTWPTSGEIDIMELLGHQPNKYYQHIHYGVSPGNKGSVGSDYTLPAGNFSDGFHQFAIEWGFDEIRWYLDGTLMYTANPGDATPFLWPFDIDYYIRLNVAVGGNWPGSPDGSTIFPQTMEVDYVRVYQDTTTSPEAWYNGDFELEYEDWETRTHNGAGATFNFFNPNPYEGAKSMCIDVYSLGLNPWDVQLGKRYFSLFETEEYTLEFWAKSDIPNKSVSAAFIEASSFAQYASQSFSLTTQWQLYTFTFTSPVSSSNLLLNFDVGQELGMACFDNVSLTRTENMINKGFENDYFGWYYSAKNGGNASFQINTSDPYAGAKSAEINVSNLGSNFWDIQLTKTGFKLEEGKQHILTFYAKSNGTKDMGVYFTKTVGYTTVASSNYTLGSQWQQYTLAFTPTETLEKVILSVDLGFETGTFYLDEFDLVVLDSICGLPPQNLSATFAFPNTMQLSWIPDSEATGYELRGNLLGQPGYVNINSFSNAFSINNLIHGASYFWQVRTNCGSKFSDWSKIDTFTIPVCEAPNPISSDLITSSSVRLNWTPVEHAGGYVIYGRAVGSSAITSISLLGGMTDQYMVSGLPAQTAFEWSVKASCFGNKLSSFASPNVFTTLPANVQKQDAMKESSVESMKDIRVFPNPANDVVYIQTDRLEETIDLRIELRDVNGRQIAVDLWKANHAAYQLNISQVPSGMYFLHIWNEQGDVWTKKFIKSTGINN